MYLSVDIISVCLKVAMMHQGSVLSPLLFAVVLFRFSPSNFKMLSTCLTKPSMFPFCCVEVFQLLSYVLDH